MTEALQTPFSEHQLELLSMFNNKSLSDEEWRQIKNMIANFFAAKSIKDAEQAWNENNWNEDKVKQLLNTHLRTPYNSNNQL